MKLSVIASILLVPVLLTGCASSPTDTPTTSEGESSILTPTLSPDVTAFGVVLAAVLITSGDIEKALSEGLVTPEEVQEAQMAIAAGEVDLWRQRAEADK